MTIFILDQDPQKIAEYLDDKSLDKQIREIAQTLCNVHHIVTPRNQPSPATPLEWKGPLKDGSDGQWSEWASECKANYEWLALLGGACSKEFSYRLVNPNPKSAIDKLNIYHKLDNVIGWAEANCPKLPDSETTTPFPLAMPAKFKFPFQRGEWPPAGKNSPVILDSTIKAYLSYYQAKLQGKPTWTRQERPAWLELD